MTRIYDIDLAALPVRPARRASVLLGLDNGTDTLATVVLDTEQDQFVRVPSIPGSRGQRLFSLSPDGTQVLYDEPYGRHPFGLFLHTLATAEHVMFDAQADNGPVRAALSPDGQTIATLSAVNEPTSSDNAAVSLAVVAAIDVATGQRRRLWTVRGTWSIETVICWRPDGTRLAVTYTVGWGMGFVTAVLDTTGRQVGLFDETQALHSGNSSWIDNDRIVCAWDDEHHDWKMTILTTADGTREILGRCTSVPLGRIGNRLVIESRNLSQFDGAALLTTDLHGGNPQPFIKITPPCAVQRFDTWIPAEVRISG